MNNCAAKLGMNNTVFDSPHGLQNNLSVSTAYDMAILSQQCMKNEVFAEVVRTPFYEVETELMQYEWQNTNRLLGHDFDSDEIIVHKF